MKIGYPCINLSLGCTTNSTFRLASYSDELVLNKIKCNLECLKKILDYNLSHNLLFFRISSDLIPFASHPICRVNWQKKFEEEFRQIGKFLSKNEFRVSMHPDQFVLINSPDPKIVGKSIAELEYHCEFLDLLNLDLTAKIQIHVGGVYGNKNDAMKRFVATYKKLPLKIRKRLVIENDDRSYSLKDCLEINKKCGVSVLFDSFHHECLNDGESVKKALGLSAKTWKKSDGILMTDYSSQENGMRKGAHTYSIKILPFRDYLAETAGFDFDIMLEIKDKEKSALKALEIVNSVRKSQNLKV